MKLLHTFPIAQRADGMSNAHSGRKARREYPIKTEQRDLRGWLLREPQAPTGYRRATAEQVPAAQLKVVILVGHDVWAVIYERSSLSLSSWEPTPPASCKSEAICVEHDEASR